jgi:hypothetical protein
VKIPSARKTTKMDSIPFAFLLAVSAAIILFLLHFEGAIYVLRTTRPLLFPQRALGVTDPVKSNAAKQLFDSQMRALSNLRGNKDPAIIPLLIPYLDYSTYSRSPYDIFDPFLGQPPPLDFNTLCDHFPAFAAIVGTPGAAAVLADYAMNPKNPLDLRVASYQVLRYLDKDKFDLVSKDFDKEYAGSNREIKVFLDAAETGDAPFKGIYPLHAAL